MSRCEHNEKITKFCITPNCNHPHSGGCEYCFKRYHCHIGEVKHLKETEVNDIIKELTSFEDKKVKIRPLKEAIYNYFNIIKGQLSTYLDSLSSDLLNKITYPYLYKEGYLNVLKKLKHKEYSKLTTHEMIRINEFKLNNPHEKLENKEILSYFEESEEVYKKIMTINNLYKQIEKEAEDSYSGESILSVGIYYKKIMEIYDHIEKEKNKYTGKVDENIPEKEIPKIEIKKKYSFKVEQEAERKNEVEFVHEQKSKPETGFVKLTPVEVEPVEAQVDKENYLSVKEKNRPRKVSIDSRCSDLISRSRLKTFEEKEKEILEQKLKLEEMMNKKSSTTRSRASSQSETEYEKSKDIENGEAIESGKVITESEMKYTQTKEEEEMGAHKYLPEGKEEKRLYEQLQSVEKKTLKIPVNVIQENTEEECQSPIMKLKKTQKPSQGFHFGLFKVQETQPTSTEAEEIRLESVDRKAEVESKSSSEASDKENLKPAPSETREMNITERETNSIFLLAESLKLSAKKATPLLEAAIKYAPHNFSAAEYLSYLYLEQNKPKECLKTCNEALKQVSGEPNAVEISVHLFNNKAAALNLLGRFSESIPILEKCLEVKKKDIFFKNLGDAYFSLGIVEKAIINYENALILNDDNHEALYNLGVCLYMQKNYESSKLKVQRALMLDQENQNYLELYKQIGVAIQELKNR